VVGGLAASADSIGQVVQLIAQIAAQTNLLALNATIEAAARRRGRQRLCRGGERGQAARQPDAKATDDISQRVDSIQSDTKRAAEAIAQIADVIGRIDQISSGVAAAMEQQNAVAQGDQPQRRRGEPGHPGGQSQYRRAERCRSPGRRRGDRRLERGARAGLAIRQPQRRGRRLPRERAHRLGSDYGRAVTTQVAAFNVTAA